MRRHSTAMLLPDDARQGGARWLHYRYRNLYPHNSIYCQEDPLAARWAFQHGGYRMPVAELKRRIRRSLGFKAMRFRSAP